MTTHTGLPVSGYRPQSDNAVALVNANKQLEEQTLRVLDELAAQADVDKRWLAIGRTAIEQGWMAINRAIFRPARVELAPVVVGVDMARSQDMTHYALAMTGDDGSTRLYFAPRPEEGMSSWTDDLEAALRLVRPDDARALALALAGRLPETGIAIVEIVRPAE